MEQLLFSSVETLPNARASVAFTEPKPVFKEDGEVTPTILSDTHSYMPWGATNQMPFDIIDLIESDETLATCQMFNAEVCYDSMILPYFRPMECVFQARKSRQCEPDSSLG